MRMSLLSSGVKPAESVHKFTCSVFILIASSLIFANCSSDQSTEQIGLAGKWRIVEASDDGVIQDRWTGLFLTFSTVAGDSGTYSFPETPYDSIWSSKGTWKLTSSSCCNFVRDDSIPFVYGVSQNSGELSLAATIYEPNDCVPAVNNPCLPQVKGSWIFKLTK